LDVFSILNGFVDDRMDGECFVFWSIDKMLTESSRYYINDATFVHFADFLIDSHTYAFKQNETDFVSVHCHYSNNYVVKLADSFEEFFEYYLTDTVRLFPN